MATKEPGDLKSVPFTLDVRQNNDVTQLVLHAENDPPVIIAEYGRRLALGANELALVSVDGEANIAADRMNGIGVHFLQLPVPK